MDKPFCFSRSFIGGWFLLLLLATCLPLAAARPRLWRQQSAAEFLAGKPAGVSIAEDGRVLLAPALEEFASLDAERIWSLTLGPDNTLYAGAGDRGRIFAVDPKGQVRLLLDSPEIAIHALTFGPDGALYAGTAPGGLIYRIDPLTGQTATLAHTGSHYVWALVFDGGGRLYAATGEPARVLAVDAGGNVRTVYDPTDRHVICLATVGERLYAGTAQEARIYEIAVSSDTASARLLYAAAQQEINSLVVGGDGALYASAIPGNTGNEKSKQPSAIFRIDSDGAVAPVWQEAETLLIDLAVDRAGRLLAAAAQPARLYRLSRNESGVLLFDFDDWQPSRLLSTADGRLYVGGAQAGRIVRLVDAFGARGELVSAVEDFTLPARWGSLTWQAELPKGTRLHLQTRSGNSPQADATWSAWSASLTRSGAAISSPPARYLQYRATLETDQSAHTPVLHEVRLFGKQFNLPPEITQLEITPYRVRQRTDGVQEIVQPPLPGSANERRRLPQAKSLHLIRWQATDPNGDELSYRIYLRGVDQQQWKLVEEDISQTTLLWDTETMPEGMTLLKLVASDHPDNPPGEALEAERISAPFAIDNSPPRVELRATQKGSELHVEGEIEDRISPISRAQYSVNYHDRVYQLNPVDGIFDSRQERVRFTLDDLPPGEHVIAVQAWDELGNVGVGQLVVQLK